MKHLTLNRALLLLAACPALACGEVTPERACSDGTANIHAQVPPIVTSKPLEKDLDVSGTIQRPAGVTIYNVWVAGVAASGTGLDFDAFTAKVPYDRLSSLAAGTNDAGDPVANIDVTARTNCGVEPLALASFTVPVNLKPGVRVSRLGFDPTLIPNNAGYLPADQTSSATLRLRANPEAAGATVTLTTSSGSFEGVGSGNTVTLSGDGKSDSMAACAFHSDRDAQISASSMGMAAATAIIVAGAPTLIPSSATLGPGQSTSVTVFTDGKLRTCQASPATSIKVTSGGVDLMATPGGKDTTGDGRVDIGVAVDSPLAAGASTTISCLDVFGQFATATFTAKP